MNKILENAIYNTVNNFSNPTKGIIVTAKEMEEIYPLIHDEWKKHALSAILQMNVGIDHAFWWMENRIVFEG